MKKQDLKIAKKLKKKLKSKVKLIDFRVFGSRVSETNDVFSDLDVYIQIETIDEDIRRKIFDTAWEVGYENNLVISTLIVTKDEVTNSPLRSSPIIKNIYQYGITI